MTDDVYFGAYWGARGESCESCAEKVRIVVAAMAASSPALTRFFEQAETKEASLSKPLAADSAVLCEWMQRLQDRRRRQKDAIDKDLGLSGGAWNGNEGSLWAEFGLRCGVKVARVGNAATLTIGRDLFREIFLSGQHISILKSFIETFQAEWGVITSSVFGEAIGAQPGERIVGFVTYTEQTLQESLLRKLPKHEPFARGRLLWLASDLPDPEDSSAVTLAQEIGAAINQG